MTAHGGLFALHINMLTNIILKQYFSQARCILLLKDNTASAHKLEISVPFVVVNLAEDAVVPAEIVFGGFGCQDIVVQSRDPVGVFQNIERGIRAHLERFNNRRYLLVPTLKDSVKSLLEIFKIEEVSFVSNVLVVYPEEDGVFNLLTHKYVGAKDSNEMVFLDKWIANNSRFLHGNNLFPDKLYNQHGRSLRLGTFTYLPYSFVASSVETSDGIEMMVGLEYARRHNMTVEFVITTDTDPWGEIYENWTGTGVVGLLVEDRADFGFSALYTWESVYGYLDLSKPIVRTGITCLVPAPRLSAGWLTPLLSFSSAMWIAVGVSFLISIIALCSVRIAKRRYIGAMGQETGVINICSASALQITAVFLIQPLPQVYLPKEKVSNCTISAVLLTSVLLTICYSSGLASIMTIPRYDDPIHTVNDLVKSKLSWGATSTAWILSIQEAKEENLKALVGRFIVAEQERLRSIAMSTRNFAFSIERLPYGYFAIGDYIQHEAVQKFRLMTEDIYWEMTVFMTRKSSILMPSLDSLILRLTEAGLPSHWESRVAMRHMDWNVQKTVKYYRSHPDYTERVIVKLKWVHIEGAFAVLAIGAMCAFICFLLEVALHKFLLVPTIPYYE